VQETQALFSNFSVAHRLLAVLRPSQVQALAFFLVQRESASEVGGLRRQLLYRTCPFP